MKMGWRIVLIALLQSLALIGMVGMKQYTLSTGVPVVLKTEPIDPRSLFSGDYVRLNYSISRLSLDDLGGDKDFKRGDKIYVVLHQAGEYWDALGVYRQMPKAQSGQVVIKGKVRYSYTRCRQKKEDTQKKQDKYACQLVQVKYGVENYYVPEGEGRELERPKAGETVTIRLVVDHYGNAAIKAVLVNGVARYVEKVF